MYWTDVSVQFSCFGMSNSLQSHGVHHIRLPCPSPTPGACSNSCPSSQWCHPTISSSVVPFSSCLQSFPISGPFPISQCFASGGQGIRASASESDLPKNIQDWFPLGWTGWISLSSQDLLESSRDSQECIYIHTFSENNVFCKNINIHHDINTTIWLSSFFIIKISKHNFRRKQWHPMPGLLPGKSHGWRSLVGCSPWGR